MRHNPLRQAIYFAIMFHRSCMVKFKINIPNGRWCMHQEPVPPDPGRDEDPAQGSPEPVDPRPYEAPEWQPVITRAHWMTEADWKAWCARLTDEDEPADEEQYPDPEDPPPEEFDLAEVIAECREISADQARAAANAARLGTTGALAAIAAMAGRRGPGQPGSAQVFPGEYPGRAAQFATGMLMDTMPGCPELAAFTDAAAGDDDRYEGASDDEVLGALCAWDRVEAHAAARKLAAVAELIRWPLFCLMMEAWTTGRNFWRKPSSGRACTAV